jgi:geranylgeranyl pyrophosphate synthase|tara:strand:+ start:1020 stop:1895 length:876 start_codon:yes stop_codon:yes gene_type:complete
MPEFEDLIQAYQERVNQALKIALPPINNSRLVDAMHYSVLNGGKRLRPILVYLSSELGKTETSIADTAACAVEFIHCYSLIHDDLPAMDDDKLRRGKPTCHIKFDEATAILAGDALQPMAYELICSLENLPDTTKISMVNSLTKACSHNGMVEGQMKDIQLNKAVSVDALDLMHEQKTGRLIEASIELGGLIGGLNSDELLILKAYGQKIGLAFQIRDDIIDVESPSSESGKPQGSDAMKEKITYPSLVGIKESKIRSQELAEEALEILTSLNLKTDKINSLTSYVVTRNN